MDSPKKPPTVLSICTGYAGLDLGLERAIGPINVLAHVEIESFSLANLVKKMETGLLAPAPIWSDLTTFPAEAFSGCVDYLIGGYPCQDFSQAGKREGFEGKRGELWSAVRRAVRLVRPRFCIFENVEGHITLGLDTVLSDLGELGYRFKVGLYSASEAGAPHQRNRVFILAYCDEQGFQGSVGNGSAGTEGEPGGHSMQCCGESALAYSEQSGLEGHAWDEYRGSEPGREFEDEGGPATESSPQAWPLGPGPDQHLWEPPRTLADTEKRGVEGGKHDNSEGNRSRGKSGEPDRSGRKNGTEVADSANERNGFHPTKREGREVVGRGGEVVGNAATEGSPDGNAGEVRGKGEEQRPQRSDHRETLATLGRDADGVATWMDLARLSGLSHQELEEIYEWMAKTPYRIDELRSCGNGVVPQQAEVAIRDLMRQATEIDEGR